MATFDLTNFSEGISSVLRKSGSEEFARELIDLLSSMVPIDDATIIIYPPRGLPEIKYFRPLSDGSTKLDLFIQAAFLLDPFYIVATQDKTFGFFHLNEISPEGFEQSEYYKSFYRHSGYRDECGYVIELIDGGFAQISLARVSNPSLFSEAQQQIFKQIISVIETLCRQQWANNTEQNDSQDDLRVRLHRALSQFGSSVLTNRQMQIINFQLHGYSTRMVSEKLGISPQTVKLHRKNAYAKLSISSQGELFHLFLDSLMSDNNYQDGDTLANYLKPPPQP